MTTKHAEKHAEGLGEFAVCGLAFDAFESEATDSPVIFAKTGEVVTCAECRRVIDHVRNCFTRYKYTP